MIDDTRVFSRQVVLGLLGMSLIVITLVTVQLAIGIEAPGYYAYVLAFTYISNLLIIPPLLFAAMQKPGAKLPTEPELCSLFGATRYAVRRAVEALAVDGKLRVEQGRGTFVESASKLNYRVGRRARFRQNLLSEGVEPDGEILSDEIVPASPAIAQALELTEGAPVHRVLQRSLADGVPISLGHTYVSALRFPEWPRYVRQGMSMSDAYRAYEVVDYFRGSTSVH